MTPIDDHDDVTPRYSLGDRMDCGSERADPYLVAGFSFREAWGRWTDGPCARLSVRHGEIKGLLLVELWIARSFSPGDEGCDLVVLAGWGEPKLFSLGSGAARLAFVAIAAESNEPGRLDIDFLVPRPKTMEQSPADARGLGVGLEAFRLTRLPDPAART